MDHTLEACPAETSGSQVPWAPIAGVIATVSVFAIAQGLSYPLMSIILERQGNLVILVGLSAAMTPCGLMASAPLIPLLSRRFGAGPIALTCAMLAALLFALIGWTENLAAWFPLRFMVGVVIGPLYVLSEVWLIGLAPPQRRGRVVGIYTTAISAGFAAGPFSLMLAGTHGWPPYLVGIAAFLACAICLAVTLPRLPPTDREGETVSLRSFLPHAPVLLLAVIVMAAFEQVALSLFPVYGLAYGIDEFGISALLAVMIAGNIALQIPIGFVAERYRPRSVLIACAALSGLGCLLLPVLIGTAWQWPFVFVWGALSYGIYTTAFLELGSRFSGSMLVAGNAAFALMWGFGGIVGPPATGALMDTFGVQGFPAVLAFLCLGLAAVALLARWRKPDGTTEATTN